jgi:DHA2 family multidrug resistance protein
MSSGEGLGARVIATGGLMLATLMVTIDMTIANVALPHMQGSLSASQEQMTWVLTSYMIATAIMTPLSGWLSIRIGRRQLFLLSTVAFVITSMLCGLATSLPEIVLFRFLQGLAGASMMPLSQAFLLDLWPGRTAQIMAVWSGAVTAAPIFGPTLGGYLTETFSWRWCFYLNIPVGLAGLALVYLAVQRETGRRDRPFDGLGYAALVLFSGGLQLMLDRGQLCDWFDSREIWTYALLAAGSLYVFVTQTVTAEHPFFPRTLFRDRNYVSCVAFSVLVSGLVFASTALLPIFMQNLMGYSAIQSGYISMPRGYGSIAAFTISPWLIGRIGPRRTIVIGWTISTLSLWQMGHFDLAMTTAPLKMTGLLQAFGSALMFNPMTVITFSTVRPALRTEAAVFSGMMRNLGGSLGIAMAEVFSVRRGAVAHEGLAQHIVPTDPMIRSSLPHLFDGADGGLSALNAEVTRQATMIGYDAAFGSMFLISLAILPLLLLMRPAQRGATIVEIAVE